MTLTVMVVVGGDEVEDRDEDDMNFELAISNLDEGKICVGSWFLRLQSTFFFFLQSMAWWEYIKTNMITRWRLRSIERRMGQASYAHQRYTCYVLPTISPTHTLNSTSGKVPLSLRSPD